MGELVTFKLKNENETTGRTVETGSQNMSRNKNARRGDSDSIQKTTVGVLRCLWATVKELHII